jgi:hypothetical protein
MHASARAGVSLGVQTDEVEYALAPLLALAVVIVLGVVSKWVFAPNVRKRKDYGLLVSVATVPEKSEAERARARLNAHGLRATIGPVHQKAYVDRNGHATVTPPGHAILVWPDDADVARELLRS